VSHGTFHPTGNHGMFFDPETGDETGNVNTYEGVVTN
jgi:hypothetical protein